MNANLTRLNISGSNLEYVKRTDTTEARKKFTQILKSKRALEDLSRDKIISLEGVTLHDSMQHFIAIAAANMVDAFTSTVKNEKFKLRKVI